MAPDDRRKAIVDGAGPAHRRARAARSAPARSRRRPASPRAPSSGSSPTRRACCWPRPRRRSTPPAGRRSSTQAMAGRHRPARAGGGRRRAGPRADAPDHVGDDGASAPHLIRPSTRTRQRGEEPATDRPPFVVEAQAGPAPPAHRALRAAPRRARGRARQVAAIALRSLIFGASRPELGMPARARPPTRSPTLLLDGVLRRDA